MPCIKVLAHQYPGSPSCDSAAQLAAFDIQTVSSEYLSILDTPGTVTVRDEATFGCNGYSPANVAYNLANANEVLVTLSGDQTGLAPWVSGGVPDLVKIAAEVATISSFLNSNNLHGLNVDIEGFSGWSAAENDAYIEFLNQMGVELHKTCKKLRVYLPAMWYQDASSTFVWRPINIEAAYNNFSYDAVIAGAGSNVDEYEIGSYDFMYDFIIGYAGEQGTGSSIAPVVTQTRLSDVLDYAISKIGTQKLAGGVANYGYKTQINSYTGLQILTYNQISAEPGFPGTRDPESQEMQRTNGGFQYSFADQTTVDARMALIKGKGLSNVMVRHLGGGNQWFSPGYRSTCTPSLALTKSDSADPVSIGQVVTWTINIVGDADSDVENIVITDVVPANFINVEYSCNGIDWFPRTGSFSIPGTMNVGDIRTIYIRAEANANGLTTNVVSATADGGVNASASENTTIGAPVVGTGVLLIDPIAGSLVANPQGDILIN